MTWLHLISWLTGGCSPDRIHLSLHEKAYKSSPQWIEVGIASWKNWNWQLELPTCECSISDPEVPSSGVMVPSCLWLRHWRYKPQSPRILARTSPTYSLTSAKRGTSSCMSATCMSCQGLFFNTSDRQLDFHHKRMSPSKYLQAMWDDGPPFEHGDLPRGKATFAKHSGHAQRDAKPWINNAYQPSAFRSSKIR